MPIVLGVLAWVGVVAMLWVGGHILLVGMDELGFHAIYDWVHHLETAVHDATGGFGATLGWITNTFFSAVLGLIVGAIVVTVLHLLPKRRRSAGHAGHAGEPSDPSEARSGRHDRHRYTSRHRATCADGVMWQDIADSVLPGHR